MSTIDTNYYLVIAGIGCIVMELILGVATGFDLLLIGLFLIAGGVVGFLSSSFPFALVSSVVLSFAYILVGRQFVKKKLAINTKNTNVDSLMDKQAVVVKAISKDHPGQVKVEGEIWRASANKDIASGATVVIQSVSGVTLSVDEK